MRTKLLLSLALATAAFSGVMAQKKMLAGYYISNEHDTVKGTFLEYRLWDKNPSAIKFRSEKKDEIKITPQNAMLFSANGQNPYYTYHGTRHLDEDLAEKHIDAFLKLIFEAGDVRLFEFKDTLRSNYYLQLANGQFTELVYTQKIINEEFIVNDSFKKQLGTVFEKELANKQLTADLASLEYTDQSLEHFFKALVGPSVIKVKKLHKPEFFIAAGVSVNRLDASIGPDWDRRKGDFDPTMTPVFSAGLQLYNQKTGGRLYYAFSLSTYSFKNETQYIVENSGTTTVKYKGSTISPCFHLGYYVLHTKPMQLYLQAGCGIMFFTEAGKSEYFVSNASVPVTKLEETEFSSTGNLNLNLQAGVSIASRFSVWGSYIVPMSMYSGETEVVNHMPLQFGVRYLFKRKS